MHRDLLYAVFAVQSGFISSGELAEIQSGWATDPSRSLLARLKEKVAAEDMELLERLVARALTKHGNNPEQTLSSLENRELVLKTLGGTMAKVADAPAAPVSSAHSEEEITPETSGRYRMKGEKNRGGMGRLLLAFDGHIGREIAIKELLCEVAEEKTTEKSPSHSSKSVRARFLREARVTGQLEHPSIVPVYEIGQHADGTCYYAMRMVRGRTISEAIRACRDLNERLKLLTHFRDLCNAIAYAHSKGVIHRDIKPENVMIGEFGETVVLDWGLAKVKGQTDIGVEKLEKGLELLKDAEAGSTVAGHALGTPAYMPPEQAMGEIDEIDEKSDIYSLGAALYEILTGQPPHTGFTAFDVIAKVLNDPIVPTAQRDKRVPKELGAIAEKALKKNKKERYDSARGLAADVEQYLSGRKVSAYEYSSWELLKRFIARNKMVSGLAVLVFVILVVSVVFINSAYHEALTEKKRAEDNERNAQYQISLSLTEKAQEAYGEKDFLSSRVFAAAALVHNPYNPYGPYRFDDIDQRSSKRTELDLVESHAALFQSEAFNFADHYHSFLGHKDVVYSVVFSPDGKILASGSWDKTIKLWSVTEKKLMATIAAHDDNIYSMAFSPDGSVLASGSQDKTVKLWDVKTKKLIATLSAHDDAVYPVAFSSDGLILASGSWDKTIKFWDVKTKKLMGTIPAHDDYVMSLDFSPDGKTLASGSFDKTIKLWSVSERKLLALLGRHDDGVFNVAFSPDGKMLASGSFDNTAALWDIAKKKSVAILRGHSDSVERVTFSPNGAFLASAGYDKTIKLWGVAEKKLLATFSGHDKAVWSVAFSPDGKLLASGSIDKTIKVRKLSEDMRIAVLKHHEDDVFSVTVHPNGKILVSAGRDKTIDIWDVDKKALLSTLKDDDIINSVVFSPDGDFFATASRDKTIKFWKIGENKPVSILTGHTQPVSCVAFSPRGDLLASAGKDKTIRLWSIKEGKLLATISGHDASVETISFSSDGKILASGSYDKTIKLWDVGTRKLIRTISGYHDLVQGVDFSPDGKMLASAGEDKKIGLWETSSGTLLRTFDGHKEYVNFVSFSPDGELLLSTSDDGTARVWDVHTGKTLQMVRLDGYVFGQTFFPDGKKFAAATSGDNIFIVPLDLDYWKRDPRELLKEAESAAGMRLDGMQLVPMTEP